MKPDEMILESASWDREHDWLGDDEGLEDASERDRTTGGFVWGQGGNVHEKDEQNSYEWGVFTATSDSPLSADGTEVVWEHAVNNAGGDITSTDAEPYSIVSWMGSASWSVLDDGPPYAENFQSVVKYVFQTGGKGVAGSQVLVAASGSASEILPESYVGVPDPQITAGAVGQLGADGLAYTAIADGASVEVTSKTARPLATSGPGAGGYRPYITANGINLSTNTPEFCVGQQVNFALNWSPSTPPIVNMVGKWNLPGEYVNQPTNYSATCATYVKNDTLLENTNATSCWFYNKPGGTVSVGMSLLMNNGHSVPVAADGSFTVYRPSLVNFIRNTFTGAVIHRHTLGSDLEHLPDLDLLTIDPNIDYTNEVDSRYGGAAYITQTFNGHFGNVVCGFNTSGSSYLDNSEIYGGSLTSVITNNSTHNVVELNDGPYCGCDGNTTEQQQFIDYIRFLPSGGISVTLGTVTWHMHEDTSLQTISGTTNQDYVPFPTSGELNSYDGYYYAPTGDCDYDGGVNDVDTFPLWVGTYINGDCN